jgi:hypothetical protein
MIAIEIRVNGELKATCGADDVFNVAAMVSARRPKHEGPGYAYVVECMGVRPKNPTKDEVLKWLNTRIALGDEVSLRVVEVAKANEPIDRQEISANAPSDN